METTSVRCWGGYAKVGPGDDVCFIDPNKNSGEPENDESFGTITRVYRDRLGVMLVVVPHDSTASIDLKAENCWVD